MPRNYKDKVDFVDPKTLDEVIKLSLHYYEQIKGKSKVQLAWKGNKKGMFEHRKKDSSLHHLRINQGIYNRVNKHKLVEVIQQW